MSVILIIEDDIPNAILMRRVLETMGHETVWATNADEGLEIVNQLHSDLILMDLRLPGLNGWDAIHILKSDAKRQHIPIVAVSGQTNNEIQRKALDAGCDAYINKPFCLQTFKAHIQNFTSS